MAQHLRTDSPLSQRIVRSFIRFLNTVEPAPDVDVEGLEVAKQCLAEVFNIGLSSIDSQPDRDPLVELFQSGASELPEYISNLNERRSFPDAPGPSSSASTLNTERAEAEGWTRDPQGPGLSTDELFGQFFGALEQIRYFKNSPDGNDDPIQLDRASQAFHSALEDMQRSGRDTFDSKTLAETLKSQGNNSMQSKRYFEAVELYTFAIALYQESAVYYCNRAAAYTQTEQYDEAIRDCQRAVELDPNYSKAYSRLGFAYYSQGKYRDAIEKGFIKALQLDPNNESVRENIRVAEQKLREERQRAGHSQSSSSASHHRQSNHQAAGGSRTPLPFNMNELPVDIASVLMNMAQGRHSHDEPGGDTHSDMPNGPGTGIGGSMNINFGEQMPTELSGALRSVMEMFSGATPGGNGEDNVNRRPPS